MIINKIKKNKGLVPYVPLKRDRSGFVILYAVMLSSIVLAITLGVANISLKEIKFGTSAKDTNDAFFAADTGAECALYYDRSAGPPGTNRFLSPNNNPRTSITCANTTVIPDLLAGSTETAWRYSFQINGLGSTTNGCTKVLVIKDTVATPPVTIISKGYNDCISSSNVVERQLEVSY